MSELVVLSPVGLPAKTTTQRLKSIADIKERRVAFLWGMHGNSLTFWPVFEEEMLSLYSPADVFRHYKQEKDDGQFSGNTWIPAPLEVINEAVSKVDYAVCGVGA